MPSRSPRPVSSGSSSREYVRGTVPKVKMHYVPSLCNHCDEAACMAACKVEGAIYKREDGLVIIDPEKCTGCKSCVDACPSHAIYMNENLNIAQKCTGCAHLLDAGWTEPRCVDACPTGALKFLDEDEAKELIAGAETSYTRPETKPRVYYLNIPKKFIGGTVYDPVDEGGGRSGRPAPLLVTGAPAPRSPTASGTSGSRAS